jgi:4-hydroxybenzoate polyprenyltransferase
VIFAAKVTDRDRVLIAFGAFAAYCLASSAAYLVNDVRDAASDRRHPLKRFRPVAAGRIKPREAYVAAAISVTVALGIGWRIGTSSLVLIAAFVSLQAAYSFRLKYLALVDVMTIGGLFVLRATAGAEAVDVPISPWLLVCTALLALFLALAKRRGELILAGDSTDTRRKSLDSYTVPLLDQLISIVAASTISAYALYTFSGRESKAMMVTIPFVLFGLFRYLYLIHRLDAGEEPENVFLRDRPTLICVATWAVTSAALLVAT